jgi:dTDP-4-amino-4,6-dideoxygalactose transaminase
MRKVPFCQVVCDGKELEYLQEVLQTGWLTTASKTQQFEERFRALVNAKYACAVNSCTAALHLALEALGVGPGHKVFVPTMTFTATAEVVRYLGADPILLDVEYGTNLLTPEILARACESHPEVRTVIVVHFGGQAAPLERPNHQGILDVCRQRNLRIVEDAAHAFPARCGQRMIGSLGDVTCFSFYANKTITTGEGGMLVTDDRSIFERVKTMRLHGIDRDVWNRYTSDRPSWEYDVVAPGFKYNLSDIASAIGLAQLERAETFRQARERCARHYRNRLTDLPGLDLPTIQVPDADHAWHLFPVVLTPEAPISRNAFIEYLAEQGISTSVHYKPLHRMTYYRQRYDLTPDAFPNAERTWQGCLSLPIYPSLSAEDLDYVCDMIRRKLVSGTKTQHHRAA